MKTREELEKENEELKAQLDQLRSGAYPSMAGAKTYTPSSQSFTIKGLAEMILVVDSKDTVGFVNSKHDFQVKAVRTIPQGESVCTFELWRKRPGEPRRLGALFEVTREKVTRRPEQTKTAKAQNQ